MMSENSLLVFGSKRRNGFQLPKGSDVFAHFIVIVAVICAAFPIYWTFVTAFKPLGEFQTYPPTFLPSQFTLENIDIALNRYEVGSSIADSVVIALGTFALSMLV